VEDLVMSGISVLRQRLAVRVRQFRGSVYLAWEDNAIELSDTAAFVFGLVDGRNTVDEIGRRLAKEYDIPVGEAVGDVIELLTELRAVRVVEGV
jgi:hypothetical protein